ncbi:macrophage mannose receptor 1-like [Brienomyrus brachyistius]|uniref:macrophage mannose receptor 1-like n=1 Tax=Brienomyrus brachyistius TaxID=42636 RepID=UPI0020B37A1C|nr:macrophage mannose receptor 1-like [Brienomyrus brachyistius]
MERSLLLLLISGLYASCSCLSHHFYYVNMNKNWTEAQRYCRVNYADLATFDDMKDMNEMLKTLGTSYNKVAWIGLEKGKQGKWQWSLADRDFYSDGETEFRNLDKNSSQAVKNDCALMVNNGKWQYCDCNQRFSFMCYNGTDPKNSQYIPVIFNVTWTDAQRICRYYFTDLVSIRNENENELLREVAAGVPMWIGLFSDTWKWSDNGNSSFRSWRAGQPDNYFGIENCAVSWLTDMEKGKMGDRPCNEKHPFICYSVMKPTTSQPSTMLLTSTIRPMTKQSITVPSTAVKKNQTTGGGHAADSSC